MSLEVPDQKKAATELAAFIGKAMHADNVTTDEIIEFLNIWLKRTWLEGSKAGFEHGVDVTRTALEDALKEP